MKKSDINVRSLFLNSDVQIVHHVGTINSVGILILKQAQPPTIKEVQKGFQNKTRTVKELIIRHIEEIIT